MDLIRDVLLVAQTGFQIDEVVTVRGRVERAHKQSKKAFVQITDLSGTIQALYVGTETAPLSKLYLPNVGERWEMTGKLNLDDYKERGGARPIPTIIVERSAKMGVGAPAGSSEVIGNAERTLIRGIALARLRRAASDAFDEMGYVEIEPKLITLTAPISGLEPLQVVYVGFGQPAQLFPSPASQLRQVLTTTDMTNVFAISRIFTTTYRDDQVSNEALTAMAMRVRSTQSDARAQPYDLERIVHTLSRAPWLQSEAVQKQLMAEFPITPKVIKGIPKPVVKSVSELSLESYGSNEGWQAGPMSLEIDSFQRLIASPRHVLGERTVAKWFGESKLEVTTIHLERFLALLPEVDLRTLLVVHEGDQMSARVE